MKDEYFWIVIGCACFLAGPIGMIVGLLLIYSQYKKLKDQGVIK